MYFTSLLTLDHLTRCHIERASSGADGQLYSGEKATSVEETFKFYGVSQCNFNFFAMLTVCSNIQVKVHNYDAQDIK
jgi:hypothetical protein